MKSPLFLGGLMGIAVLGQTNSRADDLRVEKVVFSHRIDKASKSHGTPLSRQGVTADNPLFLWTLVKGTAAAWEELRTQGKLPLRHRWTYSISEIFTTADPDEKGDEWTKPPDEATQAGKETGEKGESLRAGTIKDLAALKSEIASSTDHTFDWRSWSGKKSLRSGWYRVDVVTNDNQPVNFNGRACVLWVRVQ